MSDCTPTLANLKTYDEALALLLSAAKPLVETELVTLDDAQGRVLAVPIASPIAVPGWDNSAMDGYAIDSKTFSGSGAKLALSQRIPAGVAPDPLKPMTAARIFTGAPIPAGADCVVMQEVCSVDEEGSVVIRSEAVAGANIRHRGEDIECGSVIVDTGTRLAAQHLGLIASVGVAKVEVFRRLKVAIFSTGDELTPPGEPLEPGKIYNSNRSLLRGLLNALDCEVIDLGIVPDNFADTVEAMRQGADRADLILASGGVSVGEEDHVKPAIEHLGELEMWKIAIRPGKPVAFGSLGETHFIGSPGNPVSLFVTFLLFARPFILQRSGRTDVQPKNMQVLADFDWPKPDKRREFHRARLKTDEKGQLWAEVHPSRSSAALSSVVWADGLVVVRESQTLKKGDLVEYWPLTELLA